MGAVRWHPGDDDRTLQDTDHVGERVGGSTERLNIAISGRGLASCDAGSIFSPAPAMLARLLPYVASSHI